MTKYAYDADNRLQEVSLCRAEGEEPGSVIRYSHDPAGNLIRIQAGIRPCQTPVQKKRPERTVPPPLMNTTP